MDGKDAKKGIRPAEFAKNGIAEAFLKKLGATKDLTSVELEPDAYLAGLNGDVAARQYLASLKSSVLKQLGNLQRQKLSQAISYPVPDGPFEGLHVGFPQDENRKMLAVLSTVAKRKLSDAFTKQRG